MLDVSAQGLELIKVFEQLRLSPYADSNGYMTVGWGHLLTDSAGKIVTSKAEAQAILLAKYQMTTLTEELADTILRSDLAHAVDVVSRNTASCTQSQFDAMVSLCFNIGSGNFLSSSVKMYHNTNRRTVQPFSLSTLELQAKNRKTPADMTQAFAAWSFATENGVHTFLLGLFRRRACEAMAYRGDDVATAFKTVEAFNG